MGVLMVSISIFTEMTNFYFIYTQLNDKVSTTFLMMNAQESICYREMELMSQLAEKCEKEMVPLEEMVRSQLFHFGLYIRADGCV